MGADPELQRLRALADEAEDRYFRLKLLLLDSATIESAHSLWGEAARALRVYESQLAGLAQQQLPAEGN